MDQLLNEDLKFCIGDSIIHDQALVSAYHSLWWLIVFTFQQTFNIDLLTRYMLGSIYSSKHLYPKNGKFIQASMALENSSLGGQNSTSKALSKYWVYIKLNYSPIWWGIGGQVLFMLSDFFFKISMMI